MKKARSPADSIKLSQPSPESEQVVISESKSKCCREGQWPQMPFSSAPLECHSCHLPLWPVPGSFGFTVELPDYKTRDGVHAPHLHVFNLD